MDTPESLQAPRPARSHQRERGPWGQEGRLWAPAGTPWGVSRWSRCPARAAAAPPPWSALAFSRGCRSDCRWSRSVWCCPWATDACPLASRGTRTGSRSRGGTGASIGRAGPPCGTPAPVVPEAHLGPWPSEGLSSSQVGLSRCRGTDAQAASCACARVWGRGWRCSRSRLCTLNVGTFPLSPSESAAEL